MLRLARQAAERPGDDLPSLADLVAEARRSRAGDPYDLTMIAIAALVTGRIPDACDLLGTLVADTRTLGRIGWLPDPAGLPGTGPASRRAALRRAGQRDRGAGSRERRASSGPAT